MQKGTVGRDAQQLGEKHGQRYYVSWGHENVRTNIVAAYSRSLYMIVAYCELLLYFE